MTVRGRCRVVRERSRAAVLVVVVLGMAGCHEITSVDPDPASPGATITIGGRGFGDVQGSSELRHDAEVLAVEAWSDTEIVARLDVPKPDGSYPLSVSVGSHVASVQHTVRNPEGIFQTAFGGAGSEAAAGVVQASGGGYVVAGSRTVCFGLDCVPEAVLWRTDADGELLWSLGLAGSYANAVVETADGAYGVAGCAHCRPPDLDAHDAFLAKVDADGTLLWNRSYDGGGLYDTANAVAETDDGGFVVAGSSWGLATNTTDMMVLRTDALGNELWRRSFSLPGPDGASSVVQTSDGGYALAGSIGSPPTLAYLVRTDALGDALWSRTFPGAGHSVAQTPEGGFVMAAGGVDGDAALIETDAQGELAWMRSYGGEWDDEARAALPVAGGGYVLAGYRGTSGSSFRPDAFLVRTDASGAELWCRSFGGPGADLASALAPSVDGGFVLAGSTASFGEGGDVYLIKSDALGNAGPPP